MDIERLIDEVTREVQPLIAGSRGSETSVTRPWEIASRLEHSLLNPNVTREYILAECVNARGYSVASVCVAPFYVAAAYEALRGSGVKVCAAIGFPHGCMSAPAKLIEAIGCIENGAEELDVAVNISAVKSGDIADVGNDLKQITSAARGRAAVKAVFEHGVYSDAEKKNLLEMAYACRAEYVKIQNFLSGKGADVEDIRFVRKILGDNIRIKIDGGVKTADRALELFEAGADRIGLTATAAVVAEAETKEPLKK